jgi:hypothetical protein
VTRKRANPPNDLTGSLPTCKTHGNVDHRGSTVSNVRAERKAPTNPRARIARQRGITSGHRGSSPCLAQPKTCAGIASIPVGGRLNAPPAHPTGVSHQRHRPLVGLWQRKRPATTPSELLFSELPERSPSYQS